MCHKCSVLTLCSTNTGNVPSPSHCRAHRVTWHFTVVDGSSGDTYQDTNCFSPLLTLALCSTSSYPCSHRWTIFSPQCRVCPQQSLWQAATESCQSWRELGEAGGWGLGEQRDREGDQIVKGAEEREQEREGDGRECITLGNSGRGSKGNKLFLSCLVLDFCAFHSGLQCWQSRTRDTHSFAFFIELFFFFRSPEIILFRGSF